MLEQEGKAAVVTTVISKQTQTLVFRWSTALGAMVAHVVHFTSRLRLGDVEVVATAQEAREVDEATYEMAKTLLGSLEGAFRPEEVVDEFTPMLADLIRATAKGKSYTAPKEAAPAPTVDLVEALKASIAESSAKKTPARRPRKKAAA